MDYINKEQSLHKDELSLVFGDCTLGVHGREFHYIFSYQSAGLESLVSQGKEWLYRVPKPTFWRATTDNDRGNKFSLRSGMWLGADLFIDCIGIEVYIEGEKIARPIAPGNNRYSENETAGSVKICYTYRTITVPATNVEVSYEVAADGEITVETHYQGNANLPELPLFGMRFIMPTKAKGYRYEGLSGETYPDRMAGGIPGIYEVEGLPVTPYLVPQDCNVHMDTKWVELYRDTTLDNSSTKQEEFSIRFSGGDRNFAFSCIPYTAEELENATHQEELPPERRTVLLILGAVRGVGGINSWGADIEPEYRIDAGKDISYSFKIKA